MTSERKKLFPSLSDDLTCRDVRELAGISWRELSGWVKQGLLTPERFARGQPRIIFSPRQLAKAILIKQLRKSDWDFPEIKEELRRPDWLSRNKEEIRSIILENQRSDKTS